MHVLFSSIFLALLDDIENKVMFPIRPRHTQLTLFHMTGARIVRIDGTKRAWASCAYRKLITNGRLERRLDEVY
jgi:hypothetical protein